ncbi:hypothetical protein ANTQUA_LOCUS8745 [Anthophora quadrimaculata]
MNQHLDRNLRQNLGEVFLAQTVKVTDSNLHARVSPRFIAAIVTRGNNTRTKVKYFRANQRCFRTKSIEVQAASTSLRSEETGNRLKKKKHEGRGLR